MKTQNTILYITYDGLTEPLGYSQVLRYLLKLSQQGYSLTIMSFEKMDLPSWKTEKNHVEGLLRKNKISWIPLRYHKSPTVPATLFDVLVGYQKILSLAFSHRISIVHARSYVSALLALMPKFVLGSKFVFDMRGFWADEKVETGSPLWNQKGFLYRVTKKLEKVFLSNSDCVVSLTYASKKPLLEWVPEIQEPGRFEVIPTCADLNLFQPRTLTTERREMVLGHVGAVGLWYDFDAAIRFFQILKTLLSSTKAHFKILNKGEHGKILGKIKAFGITSEEFSLVSIPMNEMPQALASLDAVCFFIRPTFSKTASAPTKLGELLGSGIPCVSNVGIGDMDTVLTENRVGVCLRDFSSAEMEKGALRLLALLRDPDISSRCRKTAEKYFSLDRGAEIYDRIYSRLTNSSRIRSAVKPSQSGI